LLHDLQEWHPTCKTCFVNPKGSLLRGHAYPGVTPETWPVKYQRYDLIMRRNDGHLRPFRRQAIPTTAANDRQPMSSVHVE